MRAVFSCRRGVGTACALGILAMCLLTGGAQALPAVGDLFSSGPMPYPLPASPPYVIALDAGHGGSDTGAHSSQLEEVEACERAVDALYARLAKDDRFTPVRTRENGEGCRIKERAARAAEAKANVLLSIHFNSDPSCAQSHGFECFPTPPGRDWSENSLVLARCIAARMGGAGHRLRGADGVRFAYYSGKRKLIVDATDTRERTLQSFGILESAMSPAVLVEQGFLSNSSDRADWTGQEGCEKAAEAYYLALCDYFGMEPQPAQN